MLLVKDCPNCGGWHVELHRTKTGHFYYICPDCNHKSLYTSNTKKLAAIAWNECWEKSKDSH